MNVGDGNTGMVDSGDLVSVGDTSGLEDNHVGDDVGVKGKYMCTLMHTPKEAGILQCWVNIKYNPFNSHFYHIIEHRLNHTIYIL